MTNSQTMALTKLNSLKGNYLLPSEFKEVKVIKTDNFTKSLLVEIHLQDSYGEVYIGTRGQVRDINGYRLFSLNENVQLPTMKDKHYVN